MWKILSEGGFELIVANAAHIKQVPGRKTDMNDAMWIGPRVREVSCWERSDAAVSIVIYAHNWMGIASSLRSSQ